MESFLFNAKPLPLLPKTPLPQPQTLTSPHGTSLLKMGFSNGYFQSHPEPQGPFFSGYGITDSGGLYARNNPFQKSGPKGAVIQIALAKNDELYMRVDMPGVPKDKMFCFGYPYNNVYFGGLAPKEWEYDQEREYKGFYGLRCGCCQITELRANLSNGVLRMRMSKETLKNVIRCSYGPPLVDTIIATSHEASENDEPGRLQALSHPYQTRGPAESFGAIKVETGFYVWVDMPGVTKETVSVRVKDGRVLFAGEAGMDSNQVESGRTYDGSFGPFDVSKIGDIKAEMNNGVLRMLINYTK